MISHYLYDAAAESKTERNIGASLKLEQRTGQEVLERLAEKTPVVSGETAFKVEENHPLG